MRYGRINDRSGEVLWDYGVIKWVRIGHSEGGQVVLAHTKSVKMAYGHFGPHSNVYEDILQATISGRKVRQVV